jgi:hypothetical protein
VWLTDQVCWAHCQVSGSSCGPDPLIGDDHEPGRWGPRGTHVSQRPTLIFTSVRRLPLPTSTFLGRGVRATALAVDRGEHGVRTVSDSAGARAVVIAVASTAPCLHPLTGQTSNCPSLHMGPGYSGLARHETGSWAQA